jgi:hypothetical protein
MYSSTNEIKAQHELIKIAEHELMAFNVNLFIFYTFTFINEEFSSMLFLNAMGRDNFIVE